MRLFYEQVCAFTGPYPSDADYFEVCNQYRITTSPNPADGSNFYNGPELYSVDVEFVKLAWIAGLPGLYVCTFRTSNCYRFRLRLGPVAPQQSSSTMPLAGDKLTLRAYTVLPYAYPSAFDLKRNMT